MLTVIPNLSASAHVTVLNQITAELKDDRLTWGRATGERCGRNLSLLKGRRCWKKRQNVKT